MISNYKKIFDEAADAMILADGDTDKIIDVNNACCSLLKYEKEKLLQLRITDLFEDYDSDSEINDKTFMYGPVINGRKTICGNNEKLTTDITINTIKIEEKNFILTTMRDATERIEVENELKQLSATKDKFFSIIAHDLKNPLMALTGYSEILDEELETLTQEDVKQFAGSIKKLSKNLTGLIENLLSWAGVQANKILFEPESIKIKPIVENIIALCQPSVEQKEITIVNNVDAELYLICDWNMINTVIRNIVSNAIKFTKKNGTITISNFDEKNFNCISIKDNGVGMKENEISQLFKIEKHFTKQGTNKEKGTGLGLLLCKEFIDKHNGKIEVKSELEKGSEFIIKLPEGK
ncbi:MAG: ATP-binding protein [Rhodothermaceae bacterium]